MSLFRQRGMTLIEIMIAMVIGLALMAGLAQVFVSGRSSYNLQERMGDLQENGRFSLFFLQRDIRLAGYPKNDASVTAFITTGTAGTVTANGTGTASDVIAISYRTPKLKVPAPSTPDPLFVNCLGTQLRPDTLVTATYFLQNQNGRLSLMCRVVSTADSTGTQTTESQPMLEGIENMQIQYGVDADASNSEADGYGYADFYTNASGVTNWGAVVSVRVSVLATTIESIYDEDATSSGKTYTLLDATGVGPLTGGVRGKVFTTTIEIRNRTSGV